MKDIQKSRGMLQEGSQWEGSPLETWFGEREGSGLSHTEDQARSGDEQQHGGRMRKPTGY